jgi:6-pyruvoyltetrahydropterin/6-carboxytetrahydropterin synthase
MLFLTRRETFNAGHRLYNPEWSDEENFRVYGKCSNPQWHGHNYELFVTIKGEINPETGWVINLKTLSRIIDEHVIRHLDHQNINTQVKFMRDRQASTENLAVAIWEILDTPIRMIGVELHRVKIVETENNYVEYYGNKKTEDRYSRK